MSGNGLFWRISPADMASLEVLNTPDDSESFPSNDYSFLPEISTGNMQNQEINRHDNGSFNFTNMQSALTIASSDDSSVEVTSQINKLIEENNLLKETLKENNQMMEQKFERAKEVVCALETKNVELRERVASLEKNKKKEAKSCDKCTSLETGLNMMLGADYVEENQDALLEWSYFRENLYENLKYICHHLEDVSNSKKNYREKILLDCYILMLKFKMAFLNTNGEETEFASLRTDEETGFEIIRLKPHVNAQQLNLDIEHLVKVLDSRNKEVASLKLERDNFVEKIKTYELKLQECELVLKSQSELLNNKLQDESSVPQQNREKCENLEQKIKRLQNLKENGASMSNNHLVEDLKEEIQNLKEILKLEQETNKNDKEKLSKVLAKYEKLQVDYARVTKILDIQSRDEKERKKEAEQLTAKLDNVRALIAERDAELKLFQANIAKIRQERELQFSGNQSSSDQKDETGKAGGDILCPICGMGFTNGHAAQSHVNSCLDKNK